MCGSGCTDLRSEDASPPADCEFGAYLPSTVNYWLLLVLRNHRTNMLSAPWQKKKNRFFLLLG
jgi:hypothetical protein